MQYIKSYKQAHDLKDDLGQSSECCGQSTDLTTKESSFVACETCERRFWKAHLPFYSAIHTTMYINLN
jgi:hypothetical protein